MKNSFAYPFIYALSGVLMIGILATGCSTSYSNRVFTQSLYKDSGLSSDELRRVQFFLDSDVLLYRVLKSSDAGVEKGTIKMRGNERVEEVLIKKGTKGALVFMPKDDRLGISFTPGDDDKYLMFGPNSKNRNRYTLLASDWDRDYGVITYNGEKWRTSASSANAVIMVNLDSKKNIRVSTEVPKGRTVDR